MNMIRNLNETHRTVVYAAGYFAVTAIGIGAVIVLLQVASHYFGDDNVFALSMLGLFVYIVGMMSWFSAKSRVSDEARIEREVQRKLQETLSD
jgi:drug/metabolite transporter (DMT)-like permease